MKGFSSTRSKKNKKKIKLLVLVKSIDGGTGTFVFSFLKIRKFFKRGGIIIKTIVLERPAFRKIPKENFTFLRNTKFYPQSYSFNLKNTLGFLEEIFLIKKKIGQFKPHLILSIDIHCNLISTIAKMLFFKKTKLALSTHINLPKTLSQKSTYLVNLFLKNLVKFLYNQADIHICPSQGVANSLTADFDLKEPVLVVYHGITSARLAPKRFVSNNSILFTATRMVEQKDYQTLIKAFSHVRKEMPESRLLIAGDGPLKHDLKKMVQKLKLKNKVKFLGWVDDVSSYLKKSDIFVLSSKREGLPYSLLEAMVYGKPIVSTDSPFGPAEVLDQGKYGQLVPVGDVKALKTAIIELLSDKKKYDYYAAKAWERSRFFSLDKMLKRYKKIIEDLISD